MKKRINALILSVVISGLTGFFIGNNTRSFGTDSRASEAEQSGRRQPKEIELTQTHAAYRLLDDWQSILETGLKTNERDASRHIDVDHITTAISNNKTLRTRVINYLISKPDGYTRSFFERTLHGLDGTQKLEIASLLISSTDFEDHETAMYIIFDRTDSQTIATFSNIMLTPHSGLTDKTLSRLTEYISNRPDLITSTAISDAVLSMYESTYNSSLKTRFFRILNPTAMSKDEQEDLLRRQLTSDDRTVVHTTLQALLEWQYHYPEMHRTAFMEELLSMIEDISIDKTQPFDNRLTALECLKGYTS